MERLTICDDLGNIAIKNLPWSKIINSNLDMDDKDVLWKCIERLNEYEEIGLSPEDIEKIKGIDERTGKMLDGLDEILNRLKKKIEASNRQQEK